jgi:hypothetical protein
MESEVGGFVVADEHISIQIGRGDPHEDFADNVRNLWHRRE